MLLSDINVLINAFRKEAPGHVACHKLVDELINGDSAYAVTDYVINGVVRVLSVEALYDDPPAMEQILDYVDQVRNQPHAVLVNPGERHWEIFRKLCRQTNARRKLIPDAYLAALAIEHGCEFVTCDKDFARFEGLRWRSPLN
ncbi:type II toxin-antitoxin system VapC family toxin [Nonomuraea basaltis]|uniref:type II toxin-antitoxin system VapC family toxin n=1 Tax=Nonomuraea basaltis TaxID=2495887 RepID=UPI00110C55E9|nr:type II toxin-antitoxin system VapC family toxin [Nonomuraea basaltis]TMR92487.1 type II toxin-antitoxin system VapC family toxin [Nonomuraea basaltis]